MSAHTHFIFLATRFLGQNEAHVSYKKEFFCADIHFHGLDGIFLWEQGIFVLRLGFLKSEKHV